MLANQVALGIFFLYFVLMSGECAELMNCGLQRFINNNIWVKHIMIFLAIYIFTFILNWYTIESLVVEKFDNNKNENENNKIRRKPFDYLIKSFYYTIIVYSIFLLSTKNEKLFLVIFLFGAVLIVFMTIFTKALNPDLYNIIGQNVFISNSKLDELIKQHATNQDDVKTIKQMAIIQNIMCVIPVILLLCLFIGCYKYYLRQWEDHKHHWSWYIFWMGTSKCRDLN